MEGFFFFIVWLPSLVTVLGTTGTLAFWATGGAVDQQWVQTLAVGWAVLTPANIGLWAIGLYE
jgi:hypothetical protein